MFYVLVFSFVCFFFLLFPPLFFFFLVFSFSGALFFCFNCITISRLSFCVKNHFFGPSLNVPFLGLFPPPSLLLSNFFLGHSKSIFALNCLTISRLSFHVKKQFSGRLGGAPLGPFLFFLLVFFNFFLFFNIFQSNNVQWRFRPDVASLCYGWDIFTHLKFLAPSASLTPCAPLTLNLKNPKFESRGRLETYTVARGVGRAVRELPQYQRKPLTKAACMERPEEACPRAAECAFAWFKVEQ